MAAIRTGSWSREYRGGARFAGPGGHWPGLAGAGERGGLDEDMGEGGIEAGGITLAA